MLALDALCAAAARRMVMQALAEQQQWPVGWAFDGLKNMYTPEAFLPQHETHYEVRQACAHACKLTSEFVRAF